MNEKEVYFHEYCKSCKHHDTKPEDDEYELCEECLSHPSKLGGHVPVNYTAYASV